jgi:hypothetical protein
VERLGPGVRAVSGPRLLDMQDFLARGLRAAIAPVMGAGVPYQLLGLPRAGAGAADWVERHLRLVTWGRLDGSFLK